MRMKIVEIEWEDSGSNENIWSSKVDYPYEPGTCTTIGYLIEKNKRAYVLAQSDSDEQYGNVFVIPINSVKDYKEIKC